MLLTGKKIILFGAGSVGKRALDYFGDDKIYCFADNIKAGQTFLGKTIISFSEMREAQNIYDIVLTVGFTLLPELEKQFCEGGVSYSNFYELETHEGYPSIPSIRQFKNRHIGNRVFLVGNGPSLAAEDLTMLHEREEITFGCNAIGKIFCQTHWRPRYYVVQDGSFFASHGEILAKTEAKYKFLPKRNYNNDVLELLRHGKGEVHYFRQLVLPNKPISPFFSPDASKALYLYGTVMYTMIQLAIYMGTADIYLVGVDGTAVSPMDISDYLSMKRHFYSENYESVKQTVSDRKLPGTKEMTAIINQAYVKAEKYAKENGIRIHNASRGGELKIFEHVDFSSLF